MTQAQKLQTEMNQMMAEFKQTKEENTVICNAPEFKKTFSYRKTTAIKAHDLCL